MLRCIRCGACLNHCPVYQRRWRACLWLGLPRSDGLGTDAKSLIGVNEAGHLPNASTFCGRCESVCPMRIPLPKMMRHWREREFQRGLNPATARYGIKLWAYFAKRPRLYRFAASLWLPFLALFGGRTKRLRRLPFARGWTRYRDLPAPERRSFMKQWQMQQGRRREAET